MKKITKLLVLILSLSLVLSACGGGGGGTTAPTEGGGTTTPTESGSDTSSSKETLIVAFPTDPGNFKFDNFTAYTQPIIYNIIEALFRLNTEGGYDNALADSFEMDADDLGVTIKLKEGVKFHNGDPLKASDVVFSLAKAKTGGFASSIETIDIDGTKAIDDSTVYIKFSDVYGPWQSALTWVPVFSETAFNAVDESLFWISPVGTGPYTVSEWTSGDHITLTRFDDYYGGPAKIKDIIFRIIGERSVAMMELQTGGVDLVYSVGNEDVNKLKNNPDEALTIYEQPGTVAHYIGINNSKPVLADKRVREAIAYATDREALIEGSFDGNAVLNDGALAPRDLGYTGNYWGADYPYQYNPEKAKELLAEAGHADGLTLDIIVDDTAVRRSMSEQLFNMFADVGITLNIRQYDFATATDLLNNTTDFDLYLRGVKSNAGETYISFKANSQYRLCRMDVIPVEGYAEFDNYVSQIESTTDIGERAGLYGEMADKFIEDWLFWAPTVIPNTYMIHNSSLSGFERVHDNIFWNNAEFK